MRNSARVGEQTGCTKNRSKSAPSRASESMCGVRRLVLPWTLEVAPALVVGEDDDDVRPPVRGRRDGRGEEYEDGGEGSHGGFLATAIKEFEQTNPASGGR